MSRLCANMSRPSCARSSGAWKSSCPKPLDASRHRTRLPSCLAPSLPCELLVLFDMRALQAPICRAALHMLPHHVQLWGSMTQELYLVADRSALARWTLLGSRPGSVCRLCAYWLGVSPRTFYQVQCFYQGGCLDSICWLRTPSLSSMLPPEPAVWPVTVISPCGGVPACIPGSGVQDLPVMVHHKACMRVGVVA